uniref:RRM domain-containing protein n=1 Tax=Ditylum brightwellii TaxID=49249 RepID=A0A7S4QD22_9STRA
MPSVGSSYGMHPVEQFRGGNATTHTERGHGTFEGTTGEAAGSVELAESAGSTSLLVASSIAPQEHHHAMQHSMFHHQQYSDHVGMIGQGTIHHQPTPHYYHPAPHHQQYHTHVDVVASAAQQSHLMPSQIRGLPPMPGLVSGADAEAPAHYEAAPTEQEHETSVEGTDLDDGDEETGTDGDSGDADDEDEDPIKLFVGQVPKTLNEEDLFSTFAPFGAMKSISVIRDKHTGQHRGCAFITFIHSEDAEKAVETLHDKYTFPRGKKPVQVRPASEGSDTEVKLFVGMLPRKTTEKDLREIFSPFGDISAIYLIRNDDGTQKGCAFVKFHQRESAQAAINTLHGQYCMEGMRRSLVVKYADKGYRRASRRYQAARREAYENAVMHGHPNPGSVFYVPSGPGGPPPQMPGFPPGGPMAYPQPPQAGPHAEGTQGPSPPMGISPPVSGTGQYSVGQPPQYATGAYPHGSHTPPSSQHGPHPTPHAYVYQHPGPAAAPYGMPQGFSGGQAGPGGAHQNKPRFYGRGQNRDGQLPHATTPRPREGPAGANLFIYHLPHDLTDADLATAFNPFGNVISAKVYVDRYTGESKGFGFVSYDSVISAEHAIEQMNGFQIGTKRLKVQHKRVTKTPPSQRSYLNGSDQEEGEASQQSQSHDPQLPSQDNQQRTSPLDVEQLANTVGNLELNED